MSSIVTNVSSLTAQRFLNANQTSLSDVIGQLSSGLRINTAADDPAGYVRSASLNTQISGLNQGTKNTQDATSLIQTALGALNQQVGLLNQLRALALHAANTGVNDAASVAADQAQVDAIVNSIDQIAQNTSFGTKKLLNGTASNSGSVLVSGTVSSVSVGNTAKTGTNNVAVNVTTAATYAATNNAAIVDISAGVSANGNVVVNGVTIALASGDTAAQVVNKLNTAFTANSLGITASTQGNGVKIVADSLGSSKSVTVTDAGSLIFSAAQNRQGLDVIGTINGEVATGSGAKLTAAAGTSYAGTVVTLTTSGATTVASTAAAVQIVQGSLNFQIGAFKADSVVTNIGNVSANKLGVSVSTNGLNDLKTGGTAALATAPLTALDVIDQALTDATTVAANLGAFQVDTLTPKSAINKVSVENVSAALANLRDVDVASATAELTKQQILVQAATSVLAQANSAPQIALTLLRG